MSRHQIDAYTSAATGSLLSARSKLLHLPQLVEDQRPFDKFVHEREIHLPVPVFGYAADEPVQRCLDMPLRLAGQEVYALPQEWSGLSDLVQRVIDVEHSHNWNWRDYYTYLTVDSSVVSADQIQRNSGLHTDGFQGAREPERTKGSRAYVLTSNGGSLFYPQTFRVGCDEAVFNVFEGFDLQAGPALSTQEGMVTFFDCYAVHAAGPAAREGHRLFFRLVWEMKQFARAGNTHNAMLNYTWEPQTDDVRDRLRTPTLADL